MEKVIKLLLCSVCVGVNMSLVIGFRGRSKFGRCVEARRVAFCQGLVDLLRKLFPKHCELIAAVMLLLVECCWILIITFGLLLCFFDKNELSRGDHFIYVLSSCIVWRVFALL